VTGELNHRGAGPLQRYAVERIERSPRPPRDVPIGDIFRLSYGSGPMRAAAIIAVILGVLVIIAAVVLWRVALDPLLLILLGLLFGVGVPLVPLVAGLRVRRAIRHGLVVHAEVIDVADRARRHGGGPDAPTRLVGTARYEVPDGTVRTPFDVEAPWASDVSDGDVIVGLVTTPGAPLWLGTTSAGPATGNAAGGTVR
jgi:hypothetical protein